MKNSFKNFILVLFFYSCLIEIVSANEPFIFDVTEIEILKNGNQINGYNGGTATSEDGSKIIAEKFYYNKLTNILEAVGNVKYVDKIKNIVITADNAIYFKNKERIFTKGNSRAISEKNIITASNLEFDKFQNIFHAETNAEINALPADDKFQLLDSYFKSVEEETNQFQIYDTQYDIYNFVMSISLRLGNINFVQLQ